MAEVTFERPRDHRRRSGRVSVPGYPLDPGSDADVGADRRAGTTWRLVAGLVQAFLVVLVVVVSLARVARF